MGQHGKHLVWLGLTPEPERELPIAVATLRQRAATGTKTATEARIDSEVRRIERIILRGTQRDWLRYLAGVIALIGRTTAETSDPDMLRLALHAAETVLDHHQMLIGLPGSAHERVAADRAMLARDVRDLRGRLACRSRPEHRVGAP